MKDTLHPVTEMIHYWTGSPGGAELELPLLEIHNPIFNLCFKNLSESKYKRQYSVDFCRISRI